MNHTIEYLLVSAFAVSGAYLAYDYTINNSEITFTSQYDKIESSKKQAGEFLTIIDVLDNPLRIDVLNTGDDTIVIKKLYVDGILDESYIGRFAYLINHNMNSIFEQDRGLSYSDKDWNFKENPLWIDSKPSPEKYPTHTSAGLLGFKLNSNSVIPFPSGYNEDWNWCLLQTALHGTKINKTELIAFHSPSSFFKPKQEGILWEMIGECIFDLILQVIQSNNSSTLKDIETRIKSNDVINRKIDSLDSLISYVEKQVENYSQIKKQELKNYILEIKNARNSLKNSNISSLVNLWFSDLSKRYAIFSSIIKDDVLCKHVRNSLEFVKSKENVVT